MRINIFMIISTTILILVNLIAAQVTFLDNAKFRPTYRKFRSSFLNYAGRSGASDEAFRINQKRGKLQKQFSNDDDFFCDPNGPGARSKTPPQSVHKLRPGDIDVIGAMGDSLTAGNGGMAVNIVQVVTENKGISWTIGGQKTWRQIFTIPNILRVFNPKLYGYSTADGLSTEQENTRFNVAELGAMSRDTPHMAKVLVERMKHDRNVNIKNHWKMVSMLIGPNDFCLDMCYVNPPEQVIDNMEQDLVNVLRTIRDNLPRTIFNLIIAPTMEILLKFRGKPLECVSGHYFECPCFFGYRFEAAQKRYLKIIRKWQQKQYEVANREEFQNRTDFTVVIQPFTEDLIVPLNKKGLTDFTYMSLDCFHFSQKGYALATNALWNNILEPVGNKTKGWSKEFTNVKCPTKEMPFLYTNMNSQWSRS